MTTVSSQDIMFLHRMPKASDAIVMEPTKILDMTNKWRKKHAKKLEDILAFTLDRSPWYDPCKHMIFVEFHRTVRGFALEFSHVISRTKLADHKIIIAKPFTDPMKCHILLQFKCFTNGARFVNLLKCNLAPLKKDPPNEAHMTKFIHKTLPV